MKSSPVIRALFGGQVAKGRRQLAPGAAAAAVALALIGAAAWWITYRPSRELRKAAALLAEAYTRQRVFEQRLPASLYAPVRTGRREERSAFSRPIELLEAESRIAPHLAQNPDDAEWLRLRARAEMLDEDYDDAVSTLRRATDVQPNDSSLLGELGAAYALRAEGENREIDYGGAIDLFWRFLRTRPDAPLALFNRALVYEKMFLFDDARKDWEHYLRLDPVGGWADEARAHKQAIERKAEARDQALKSLASASGFLQAFKEGRAWDAEFYLDSAVTDWLPASATDASAREAVQVLARLLKEKHSDPWLEDLLKAKQDARFSEATAHLAAAVRQNLADEAETALEEAIQAQRLFHQASQAGELRAKYEEVMALYRSLKAAKCLALADQLVTELPTRHYGWILSQALMEQGNCRAASRQEGGERSFDAALAEARARGYRTAELRALGLLGGNATTLGNQLAAWQRVADYLATCWEEPHRVSRPFQFYLDLSRASVTLGYRYSAFVFRRASAEEISKTNRVLEAYGRALLASLADSADLPDEAAAQFNRANQLFSQCRQTEALKLRRFAAEVARADFEGRRNPQIAWRHLQKMMPSNGQFPSVDTELILFQSEGRAKLALGDVAGADVAFRRAIQCSEQELASLATATDREGPVRKSGEAYRGAVSILLRQDASSALRLWEWYRAADLPGSSRTPERDSPPQRLTAEVGLSYVVLPDGRLHLWVLSGGEALSRRLVVSQEQLAPVVSRFLRECADPKSSVSALRRDASQLYDWLIAPAADQLKAGRILVIEPDGPIGALPLQGLIDPAGRYLGEQFPIVTSRSMAAWQGRSLLATLTSRSPALIMANPALGNELAKTFPPLEDAAREAREIGAMFTSTRMLNGKESTLEALDNEQPRAAVFHFAGHSIATDGDAGLLLASSTVGEEGRLLKSSQVLRQDWSHCSLVVLSACSTGTGERHGFVNPESLVRAFLNAGAGRVVASRWNVDTSATAGFMRHFYQSVLSGDLPAIALREAAETLRSNPATAHPYYWAAFQLFGYK
jgi:CHAT domain-containing protein